MLLADTIRGLLIGKSRKTPSGWESINCPACIHSGEPTPDDRRRGGLNINLDGSVTYNCLRCHYKAHWHSGMSLNHKMQRLLLWLGMDYDRIKELSFKIWIENQRDAKYYGPERSAKPEVIDFPEVSLPGGAKPLEYWLDRKTTHVDFKDVCEYLVLGRGQSIAGSYTYFWTPNRKNLFNRSIIVPFYWRNKIVGYSARRIDKRNKVRYYAHTPKNYLFMNNNIDKPGRKWIVIVEGVFDAIALDAVGALGGSLNDAQIQWIKNSGREVIVVPDRAKSGNNLANIAKEQGWWVSIPLTKGFSDTEKEVAWAWDPWIKDGADAVKEYGRLFTIKSIFESITKDSMKIDLWSNMMFGNR